MINSFTIKVFEGDKNSFLFKFPSGATSYFRLAKLDSNGNIEILPFELTTGVYGTKFDLGSIVDHPDYSGYILDWQGVFDNYNTGTYFFCNYNLDNPDSSVFSLPFDLCSNYESKNNTLYVEIKSDGIFDNFLYNDSETISTLPEYDMISTQWVDSCRYEGKIIETPIESETTESITLTGDLLQAYTEDFASYQMDIFRAIDELIQRLFYFGKHSNPIKITSDSDDRQFEYININVVPTGTPEWSKFPNNRLVYNANIKLREAFDLGFRR